MHDGKMEMGDEHVVHDASTMTRASRAPTWLELQTSVLHVPSSNHAELGQPSTPLPRASPSVPYLTHHSSALLPSPYHCLA